MDYEATDYQYQIRFAWSGFGGFMDKAVEGDATNWWYVEHEGGETKGPVSRAEIARLIASKKLGPTASVWMPAYGEDWRTLEESGCLPSQAAPEDRVYPVPPRWQKTFERLDAIEHMPDEAARKKARRAINLWSIPGYLFGPMYYFYLRMWQKGIALCAIGFLIVIIEVALGDLLSSKLVLKAINTIPLIFCAYYVKRDYFRFKMHDEKMWPIPVLRPFQSIYGGLGVIFGLFVALVGVAYVISDDVSPTLLSDVSGVWVAQDNSTFIFDLAGSRKRIFVNGREISVEVKDTSPSEGSVTIDPVRRPDFPIKIRKVYTGSSSGSFKLSIDMEGREVTLGYRGPVPPSQRVGSIPSNSRTAASSSTYGVDVAAYDPDEAGESGIYCKQGKMLLESQILQFRRNNIPVDDATDTFSHETNFDYQQFMMTSVRELYENPDDMREQLSDGHWMRACIQTVRGF